ncbi:PBSX family phage terminase large subunit [Escherichia coli]|nr:PBSX family phage terminase large subunit [Escherichia coli]
MTSINPIFEPLIEAHRYKVAKGGRGSGKSWAIARLLVEAARRQPVRILCARELQNSISDSVIRLLEDTIEREGYSAEFEIQRSMIRHLGTNAEFMFYGIKNNPTKIKSLEGIDICWVEEAEAVTKESWDILIPTIRKPFSEIWVSFNPKNILDDTYQRFVVNPPDDICLLTVNYTDNPHFPEVLRLEMEECKRRNPTLYRHIWLGEPVSASDMAIIKREWLEAATDAHKKLGWKAKGAVVSAHDPSDTGPDAKGYASRHGSVVKRIAEGLLMDINDGADWATSLAIEDGADHYLWDGDGVGAGLRRQTTEAFSGKKITATMFKGSESPFDEDAPYQAGAWADEVVQGDNVRTIGDVFRNKRAQFYYALADRLYLTYRAVVHGEYADPDDMLSFDKEAIGEKMLEKLFAELTQIQRKFNNNGKLELMTKVEMKQKLGIPSPNAFYEGIDNEGNMVRVPASSIAAPATSSASAQNYAMKKDIDAIANADASALDFMTGMTGGAGNPAIGADVRSRLTGKEQRQLYNSAQRIQGRMQNQGVAAARDMGASGINTVAEAKMYFQGMPQVDYSSPEAMQQSIREIQEYTNNYNQQYNVNVGKSQRQQSQPTQVSQPAASSNFSSLWGD